MDLPARYDVVGVRVAALTFEDAVRLLLEAPGTHPQPAALIWRYDITNIASGRPPRRPGISPEAEHQVDTDRP